MKIKPAKLLLSLTLCFAVAAAGSAVTVPSIMGWYTTLNKPFFNPPNGVFGPVWTVLYLCMAIALALVWSAPAKKKQRAYQYFFIQLALNFLWSLTFFSLHLPLLALFVIIALWISIYKTYRSFLPIVKSAAYLLLPYLAWVSFATLLNIAIVLLNP